MSVIINEPYTVLKLKRNHGGLMEYTGELTEFMDNESGIDSESKWKHYIMIDKDFIMDHAAAIRIPGGTVGTIRCDNANKILSIKLDGVSNGIIVKHPDDLEDKLNEKFAGKIILRRDNYKF